jgi:hypothetical protein
MNSRDDFRSFEVIDVTLSAYRAGSCWVIVDKNGKSLARLQNHLLARSPMPTMRKKLWLLWAKWSQNELLNRETQRIQYQQDPWATKVETWASSIRIRLRWESHRPRSRRGDRFFAAEKRTSWDKCFDCLSQQLSNSKRCAFVSKQKDEWNHWADTCGKNHRRKDLARRKDERRRNANSRPEGVSLFS